MCPHTAIYMCPHTAIYVSHTAIYVSSSTQVWLFAPACKCNPIYVSSYCCICVPILLYMCPHTTKYASSSKEVWLFAPACNPICVSSYCYVCVLLCKQCPTSTVGGKGEKKLQVLALGDCVQSYMCAHTAIYVSYCESHVSAYCYICMLLCACCVCGHCVHSRTHIQRYEDTYTVV